MSEFGTECQKRKMGANVGKSKVMKCSRCVNVGRMHVRLNGEPLGKVHCFQFKWQSMVQRMNDGYKAWGAL